MALAQLIDGRLIAARVRNELSEKVKKIKKQSGRAPSLAVVLVGEDPASMIYVRSKEKYSKEVGIDASLYRLSAQTGEKALLDLIDELNESSTVDGILVQLPLPPHINAQKIIERIDPRKDVDGLTPLNQGYLMTKREGLVPCTPQGCLELIKSTGISLEGKTAVVVGRSLLVGSPMAHLLLKENCTVIQTHSKTKDIFSYTRQADVLVVAAGRTGLIRAEGIKDGAVVIDVGINRGQDGHLCGDVVFEEAVQKAAFITPVPGGVGPMTIAMLLKNTVQAAAFFLPQSSDVIRLEEES